MSAAFPAVAGGDAMFGLPGDVSIVTDAFVERVRSSYYAGAEYAPSVGEDALVLNASIGWRWNILYSQILFYALQKFADHTLTPYTGQAAITLFASATVFFTVAGLSNYHFRRAATWNPPAAPAWQYGYPQHGDICGPWIVQDLQAVISALKWAVYPGTISAAGRAVMSLHPWGLWQGRPHACDCYVKRRATGLLEFLESQAEATVAGRQSVAVVDPAVYSTSHWVLRWNYTYSN